MEKTTLCTVHEINFGGMTLHRGGGIQRSFSFTDKGAFTADGPGLPFMTSCASLCPTLLPQAEDILPRSGEQHIAATSTAPVSVVGKICLEGSYRYPVGGEHRCTPLEYWEKRGMALLFS